MDLGQKIKQARLEAGLSQRQLCGEEITRNMLSQIENGSARPSTRTLQYLAGRLGKSVDHFLQENGDPLDSARTALLRGDPSAALALTEHTPEGSFLRCLGALYAAENAIAEGKMPYARQLLEQIPGESCPYFTKPLERQRLLLLSRVLPDQGAQIVGKLSDDELFLRARVALEQQEAERCAALLDSAESRSEQWCILRGDACMALGQYRQAMELYRPWAQKCRKKLEQCCLALEDYKGAYYYATMQS